MQELIIGIIIIGIVGGGATFLLSTGRIGSIPLCGGPCPGREALVLETYSVNSPSNVTVTLRNIGTVWISLVSYSVKVTSGQTFSNSSLSNIGFGPNALLAVHIVMDGQTFTFQNGNSYTAILVTARNNEFSFMINT